MSSTRTSTTGEFHQERFCSAPELEGDIINGLPAAKRIALMKDRATREVLWFIQWRSLTTGGVQQICDELLVTFPERIGTPTLRKVLARKGRRPTRSDLKAIQEESGYESALSIEGFLDTIKPNRRDDEVNLWAEQDVAEYMQQAHEAAREKLRPFLIRCCLDPKADISKGVWFFDDLVGAVRILRERFAAAARSRLAETAVKVLINETLDFWFASRRMILIEGAAGIGRSVSTRAWIDSQCGLARFVEVPSSGDDRSFFSAIARELGVARGTSMKAQEIKVRVEEMLLASGIMLVFDESQYLWGGYVRPRKTPDRILWIKMIFDADVPVALIAHTDFSKYQANYVKQTLWTDEQFERRLNRRIMFLPTSEIAEIQSYRESHARSDNTLMSIRARNILVPSEHSRDDMLKIARAHYPEGNSRSWKLLAAYALGTDKKQASGIVEALESARYRADKNGRSDVTFADIEAALTHDHGFLKADPQAACRPIARRVKQPRKAPVLTTR